MIHKGRKMGNAFSLFSRCYSYLDKSNLQKNGLFITTPGDMSIIAGKPWWPESETANPILFTVKSREQCVSADSAQLTLSTLYSLGSSVQGPAHN